MKQKKDKDPLMDTLTNMTLGLGLSAGLMGMIGGQIGKMFGTNEIPKGVVKELMEGIMDGLIYYFQGTIDELKRENEDLKIKQVELEDKLETAEMTIKSYNDKINEAVKESNKKKKK